jgi:Ca-activated chloride channel family protein
MSLLFPQALLLLLVLLWLYQKSVKKAPALYLALALMIVALARPILKESIQNQALNAREFIIAFDISYSMQAKDITPSRLEKAKIVIQQILQVNPKDRFALFAFTSNPLILSPSTSDHTLLLQALHALDEKNILTHSTNLKKLFEKIASLPMEEKNLILLSDGGEEKEIAQLLSILKEGNIRLFTIAMATKKGATLIDKEGKKIKDERGNLLISRRNPILKPLSIQSGGAFFTYDNPDLTLSQLTTSTFAKKAHKSNKELYILPLLLAVGLLFFHFVQLPKKLLLLLPFLQTQADALILDWYYIHQAKTLYDEQHFKEAAHAFKKIEHQTLQSQMNLANCYYQAGAYTKAKALYLTLLTTDPTYKQRLLFKLGNIAVKLKDFESARGYYETALALGKDEDILHNLSLIIHKKNPSTKAPTKKGEAKEKVKSNHASAHAKGTKKKAQSSAPSKQSHPLGYKAYELINKGYIDEKKPW